jgi:hypothetical protein
VPFGRIPVRAEPDGWRLVPDPAYAAVVVELVRRCMAGDSSGMLSASCEYGFPVPEARRGLVILVVMLG